MATVVLALFATVVLGQDKWVLMQNNIKPNETRKQIGGWNNWLTGYHVNQQHDGYLDIGDNTFDATKLKMLYSTSTNCSDQYPIFANGRIYCVSNNMIFSVKPADGSIEFWYLNIGPITMKDPTFVTAGSNMAIFTYSYSSYQLYINTFDAMTGELKRSSYLSTYSSTGYYSPYATGTSYGKVYLSNRNRTGTANASVYAYDITSYQFAMSQALVGTYGAIPSLCDNKVMTSGYYGYTNAFNPAPDFTPQWAFPGTQFYSTSSLVPPPVCVKNKNGMRVIVKPGVYQNYNCYVLDAVTGEQQSLFQCADIPIFHYDKDGNADLAIIMTGTTTPYQVLATQTNGDQIVSKELWYGPGDTNHGFIVKDYFVTAYKPTSSSSYTLEFRVYDIYTGDVIFEDTITETSYSFTYAVFGGLYDDGDGDEDFMIVVRTGYSTTGNTFRTYTESDITTTTTTTTATPN